jgi:hypothetical protein
VIGDFWFASFFSIEFGVRRRVDLPDHSVNPDVVIRSSIKPMLSTIRRRPS